MWGLFDECGSQIRYTSLHRHIMSCSFSSSVCQHLQEISLPEVVWVGRGLIDRLARRKSEYSLFSKAYVEPQIKFYVEFVNLPGKDCCIRSSRCAVLVSL